MTTQKTEVKPKPNAQPPVQNIEMDEMKERLEDVPRPQEELPLDSQQAENGNVVVPQDDLVVESIVEEDEEEDDEESQEEAEQNEEKPLPKHSFKAGNFLNGACTKFIMIQLCTAVVVAMIMGAVLMLTSGIVLLTTETFTDLFDDVVQTWEEELSIMQRHGFVGFKTSTAPPKYDNLDNLASNTFDRWKYANHYWAMTANDSSKLANLYNTHGHFDTESTVSFTITSEIKDTHGNLLDQSTIYEFELEKFRESSSIICKSCETQSGDKKTCTAPTSGGCIDDRHEVCQSKYGASAYFDDFSEICYYREYLKDVCVIVYLREYGVDATTPQDYYQGSEQYAQGYGCFVADNGTYQFINQTNKFVSYWLPGNYSVWDADNQTVGGVQFGSVQVRDVRDPDIAAIYYTDHGYKQPDFEDTESGAAASLIVLGAVIAPVFLVLLLLIIIAVSCISNGWHRAQEAYREEELQKTEKEMTMGEIDPFAEEDDKGPATHNIHHLFVKPQVSMIYRVMFFGIPVWFVFSLVMTVLGIICGTLCKVFDWARLGEDKHSTKAADLFSATLVFAILYVVFEFWFMVEIFAKLITLRLRFFYLKESEIKEQSRFENLKQRTAGVQWVNLLDLVIILADAILNLAIVFIPVIQEAATTSTMTGHIVVATTTTQSKFVHIGDIIVLRLFVYMLAYRPLYEVIVGMFKSGFSFSLSFLFLLIMVYFFGLIGNAMYGDRNCEDTEFCEKMKNPYHAAFFAFQILCQDTISGTIRSGEKELPGSGLYWVLYLIISSFIVLNIVTGMVISNITSVSEDIKEERRRHRQVLGALSAARRKVRAANRKAVAQRKILNSHSRSIRLSLLHTNSQSPSFVAAGEATENPLTKHQGKASDQPEKKEEKQEKQENNEKE